MIIIKMLKIHCSARGEGNQKLNVVCGALQKLAISRAFFAVYRTFRAGCTNAG
jgi:hypothetical protein